MGVEFVDTDSSLETTGHDVNRRRQLACPETHVLHAVLHTCLPTARAETKRSASCHELHRDSSAPVSRHAAAAQPHGSQRSRSRASAPEYRSAAPRNTFPD